MDNQQQISEQPSTTTSPQAAQKSRQWLLILGAILFLGIGAIGGYIFANTPHTPVAGKNGVAAYPSPTVESKEPPADRQFITIKPLNESTFKKYIVSDDQDCGLTNGIVSYSDNSSNTMTINNPALITSQFASDFLTGKKNPAPYESLGDIEGAFRIGCGGYYTLFVKELPGITYPGTDFVKAYMVLQGQGIFGSVAGEVLAQSGDNFILLHKIITDYPKLEEYKNTCFNPERDRTSEQMKKADDCYNNKVISDKDLEEAVIRQTKELVTLFSIK